VVPPEPETATHSDARGFAGAIALSALAHVLLAYLLLVVLPRYFEPREIRPPAYTVKMVDSLPAGELAARLPPLAPEAQRTLARPKVAHSPKPNLSAAPASSTVADKNAVALAFNQTPTAAPSRAPSVSATPVKPPTPSPVRTRTATPAPTPTPPPTPTPEPSKAFATPTPQAVKLALASVKPTTLASRAATPTPTLTPTPTPSPSVTPTFAPTPTPTPSRVPTPRRSATPSNASMRHSPTPKPVATPILRAKAAPGRRPTPIARAAATAAPKSAKNARQTPQNRAHATPHANASYAGTAEPQPTPDVHERLEALRRRLLAEHLAMAEKRRGEQETSTKAHGGGIGEGSGSSGIQTDPAFLYYYQAIRERIKRQWTFYGGNSELTTVVTFSIDPNGNVTATRIVRSSNDRAFDNSVVRAIRSAAPFPPPPEKYREQFQLGIEAVFKLGELSAQG
jgi:TonB family protein